MRTRITLATAMAAALICGPAAAQNVNDNWLNQPDPFMQERLESDRDWYEGPMAQWYENRYGRELDHNRAYRDNFNRGYQAGRADERMWRDRGFRDQQMGDQVMRDRDIGRATYSEARDYLNAARRQMNDGELRAAWVSLGRAETRLVTRVAGRDSAEQAAAGGAVGAIREARRALMDRDTDRALNLTQRAQGLVRQGYVIGEAVSGRMLSGAGTAGSGQPFYNDRTGGN